MKLKDLETMINEQEATVDSRYVGAALPALLRKTYLWMAFAMIITGIVAYGMATVTYTAADGSTLPIAFKIFQSRGTFWILFIAELGMVFTLSARIMRLSLPTATLLFIAYSAVNGVMLSAIFLVYTMQSIASAFFVTAGSHIRSNEPLWLLHEELSRRIGQVPDYGLGRSDHRNSREHISSQWHAEPYHQWCSCGAFHDIDRLRHSEDQDHARLAARRRRGRTTCRTAWSPVALPRFHQFVHIHSAIFRGTKQLEINRLWKTTL